MKKNKQQLTRLDKKYLKQCLQKVPSNEPLYLLFQLSNQMPEIEDISQSIDSQHNDLFSLYALNESHFLNIHDDVESVNNLSPTAFQHISRLIKKNHKTNPQTLGISLDARYLRIAETNDLFVLGQNIREQIDAIRNDTSHNIPIVLIIRNMEDIDGFELWTHNLPDAKLEEAFGFAIPDEEIEAKSFISAAFRSFNDHLSSPEISSESTSYDFLQSFIILKNNLVALTNGLIQTQPDLVPPKFIGLYFMGMINHPVNQTDESDENRVLIRKPAFVSDVFHRIFAQAASYGSYFQPESRPRFLYKAITLSIVICLLMAIGTLFMIYQSHKNTLQNTYSNIANLQKNITTPQDAIIYFHSLSHHIVALDTTISGWWLPWLGFSSENDPLNRLKQNYVKTFRKYLLKPLIDQFMQHFRTHLSKRSAVKSSDQEFHQTSGKFIGTLVYYIDFANQFMGTYQKENFIFKPNAYKDGKGIFENQISGDRFNLFMISYTNALLWAANRRLFRKDLHLFNTSVEEMVVLMPNIMEWTYPIVNSQQNEIDLLSLWLKNKQTRNPNTKINAAFTKNGYEYIQNLFKIIRHAHKTPSNFDTRLKQFNAHYEADYFQKWEQAAHSFDKMSSYLETREEWADIVLNLYDVQKNPYFQMIDLIVEQTQPFLKHQKKWPQWLQLCHRLHDQTILEYANHPTNALTKTTMKTETANVFNGYLGALKKIAQLPNTPEVSYELIKTLFVNPDTFCPGDGPDTIACLSIFQLQSIWDKKDPNNAVFWELYKGPINFIRKFSLKETACQLQHKWEEMVVSADLQMGNNVSLIQQQKAESHKYMKTYASPFLEKITQTRYVPKRLAGLVVPFRESFFKYVAYHPRHQEKLKEKYQVIIKATPSRTNTLATSQPQLTLIKMKCNQNQQIMVIGHQPTQETFYWSEACGPVHVTFHLKDMKLTRSYPNPMAFPKFIRDVQYGSKRFHRSEFVLDKARLKSMNIEFVELKLQLFGHESIAKAQKRGFITAPEKITYCWESLDPLSSGISKQSKQKDASHSDISDKTKPKTTTRPKQPPKKPTTTRQNQSPKKPTDTQTPLTEKSNVLAGKNIYLVILASFRNDTNAVNKAKRLTQNGLKSAVYWLKDKDENPWYIVVSGKYASYGQALESIEQIKKTHNIDPFIKKMEQKTIEERKVNINF
jgi:cell division septation protein DedD